MIKSAQNIEVADRSITAPVIIEFPEKMAQGLQRRGARGDEKIYINFDIGMKAEKADIHYRVRTIDALYFDFDEDGLHISADHSPDGIDGLLSSGIEGLFSGEGDVNEELNALPDYLICRLQPILQHIVFRLLTRFYEQTSQP